MENVILNNKLECPVVGIGTFMLSLLFIIGAVYGVYAFVHRGIGNYLLMKTAFAFFDMNEPRIWFFLDYMAVMILFATLGYLIQKGLLHVGTKGKRGA